MMLSLWDINENVTLSVDLWTKEITKNEMEIYFYQILLKMADTIQRATNDFETSGMIGECAGNFARSTNINSEPG